MKIKRRAIVSFLLMLAVIVAIYAIPENTITLTFPGDIMVHDVKDVLLANDLSFSNLEAPVDEKLPYKTYPRFNIIRDYVQTVIEAGVDNPHVLRPQEIIERKGNNKLIIYSMGNFISGKRWD
jgi:hypothetical protein